MRPRCSKLLLSQGNCRILIFFFRDFENVQEESRRICPKCGISYDFRNIRYSIIRMIDIKSTNRLNLDARVFKLNYV